MKSEELHLTPGNANELIHTVVSRLKADGSVPDPTPFPCRRHLAGGDDRKSR